MNVVKHIICELTGYRPGTVDVSQGDRGSRAVSCRLMESGAPWMIPEGATARVAYTLPDGTEGLYDRRPDGSPMWEISGNTVTVELADQLMAQAGMVQMSILIIGPDGGQLATWPIRVMVIADNAARLTVPEAMPPYGAGFAGKLFYGGEDGVITPLGIGDGVAVVQQEDGTFALVAYGGAGGGGGITEEKDPTVPAWAKQPQKPTYTAEEVGALPKDTKIPGKTSELTNDAGFVTKAVSDLANYYTKVQTQELIAAIPRFRVTVVQQLPAAGEDLVLYLIPFATAEGQYLEYIWVDGRWEIIGSQRVDLTGYATEEWVQDYVEEHSGQNLNLDATLTKSGEAADAKATGDEIKRVEGKIPSIEGLAKTEDIPTRPEDIGAQPAGNYLTQAPVESVNGKTGTVQLSAADVDALPRTYIPPNQTAAQVGADPKGTAESAVAEHNTATDAHNDIRVKLEELRQTLAHFFNATTPETMDQISELVSGIEANADLIAALTTGKVSVSSIVANLTTNLSDRPLAASMGVELKKLIDQVSASLENYQPKGNYAPASAVPTKVSQLQNDSKYLTAVTAAMITAALGYTPINPGLATLDRHTDGLLYLFVNGKPVGSGVELPTGGIDGYVDADNNIVVRGLDEGVIYKFYFEMADGSRVEGGELVYDNTVYYTVTNTLTNCTNSNSATQAIGGQSYSATVTAKSGYELESVTVAMGGVDISSTAVSGGNITIAKVTGNIVITAVAEEIKAAYTNILTSGKYTIQKNKRWSGSGKSYVDCNGMIALTIPIADVLNKTIYLGGFTKNLAPQSKTAIWMYTKSDSSQASTFLGSSTGNVWDSSYLVTDGDKLYSVPINADTGATTSGVAYLVINLGVSTSAVTTIPDTFIITINEPIE